MSSSTPWRIGRIVYRPKCSLPGKTFCESEQRCEFSPKLSDLGLEPAETVKLRPLRQGFLNATACRCGGWVAGLDAPDRLAGHPCPGGELFAR